MLKKDDPTKQLVYYQVISLGTPIKSLRSHMLSVRPVSEPTQVTVWSGRRLFRPRPNFWTKWSLGTSPHTSKVSPSLLASCAPCLTNHSRWLSVFDAKLSVDSPPIYFFSGKLTPPSNQIKSGIKSVFSVSLAVPSRHVPLLACSRKSAFSLHATTNSCRSRIPCTRGMMTRVLN